MSEFLRNLAARSKGTLETVRPRVPSRFEPVRSDDGLLAARTPPREESVEDNPEAQRAQADEVSAAMEPVEKRVRAARPTRPTDLSPRLPSPAPVPAESAPEPLPTQPAARPTARAGSPVTPPTPAEPVLQAKRIPGSETVARRTIAETVTQPAQNTGHVPELEPTGQAVESATAQRRETNEGAIQSRTGQEARTGQPTRSAQALRPSSANAPDSGFIVSPTVRTPALPEQINERPARAAFLAASGSEIEPRMLSSQATEPVRRDEAPTGQSQPRRALPMTVEPARTGGVLQDGSREEAGPETEDAPGRPWPGDPLTLKPELRPDLSIRPAPRQETATLATGAEHAAARPAAANRAAPQAPANGAPEPEIRVTIGRVEVRAVFPEQPVKRSPPPRFRPSVTLDDYLSRGSGAKR